MPDSLDKYGLADLRDHDPRNLRIAAMLIEAEQLAAQVRRFLPTAVITVDLTVDMDTAATVVESPPDVELCLDQELTQRLCDVLREMPGEPGLRRFLKNYPYGYL